MSGAAEAGNNVARQDVRINRPESQKMNFNFDFSMPIQDTFTITRDPNRFPVTDVISNAPTISQPDPPRPNRLTTVYVDVQNYIMAFLSMHDLSALMRTCRYFLDACLLPLCARSMALRYDGGLTRLPSFRQFLRINAGPSSRAHLIKEFWIAGGGTRDDKYISETRFISIREQWSAALLDVLRHCRNVRRLRIDDWFLKDISFPLLVKTIASSMYHLEHLTIPMPYETEVNILRRFAHLPLCSLSFLKYPNITINLHPTPISLEWLPRSLTELDIHGCPRIDAPFPMVQKLGIRETMSETFVADATAAFPNVAHLILRRHRWAFLPNIPRSRQLLVDARTRNKAQWQSKCREAWPSVSTIWAEDPSFLYALGFSRQVSCISIPLGTGRHGQEDYVSPVLADTSPTFLELRVNMDNFAYSRTEWELPFGPGSSVIRLTLLLHWHIYAVTDKRRVSYILGCLNVMLPALPSLTHLLVKFAPTPQNGGTVADTDWTHTSTAKTRVVHGTIQKWLRILADTSTSLRWIGYEVHGLGVKSWDIPRTGSEERPRRLKGLKMTEMSESASLTVLRREGMNEFRDVKSLLTVL
ncbi:hypothetical protein LXA43DRAFT_352019 [Ganoderma leucocontextum]|nr:hypothetical protein LXA43DRAFT_352019 [Ganoderma leucocontextum]